MQALLHAFWFFLPAGVANMAPVFANRIPLLNRWKTPLDFGKKISGKQILGANKTWRGLTCGILLAAITGWILYHVRGSELSEHTYVLGAAALGAGALLGDAIKSFFKRRAGVAAGDSWFPFDQLDYIIGSLLVSYPFLHPTAELVIGVVILYFSLHLAVSYIGYTFGFKASPI